ncbi:MAG: class I SAM-dependent methyltransferase [bacterium]|nr:class I SAM-dependent methyltransferase [bacterium]
MSQQHAWNREYRKPQLLTKGDQPQAEILTFLKFLRKSGENWRTFKVLDLGCGTGRNTNFWADEGCQATGVDISENALRIARERAEVLGIAPRYQYADMGKPLPFKNEEFDLALDVMASNSLSELERETFLKETARVLRPSGYFFVRALAKEGDTNAKELLKKSPGKEKDTYTIKELGITERVFTKVDFEELYSAYFQIIALKKVTHYPRMNNRVYRRNYWIAYLKK